MSVSNSSARILEGLRVKACHTDAMIDLGEGRAKRPIHTIDMVRRTGIKVVTHRGKKYKTIMKQHKAILAARKEREQ